MSLIKNKEGACEKKKMVEKPGKKGILISQTNSADYSKANKRDVPEIEKREFIKRGAIGLGVGAAVALVSKVPFVESRFVPGASVLRMQVFS